MNSYRTDKSGSDFDNSGIYLLLMSRQKYHLGGVNKRRQSDWEPRQNP
jgi:hypothetical protein